MNRRVAALAIAVVSLFGLTACTAPSSGGDPSTSSAPSSEADADAPGGDGQSVADACALVRDTVTSATDEFDNAAEGDPGAVVDAMRAAADDLAELADKVTNEEVAALLPDLRDMYLQMGDVMAAVGEGDLSKLGELAELGGTMQETMQQFQELCLTE